MDTPGLVTRHLGEEEPFGRVSLGGEDLLLVTPSRTVVYRAEGLLRDESVASYPHECDRVVISEGRRKATLRFEYLEGPKDFSVPRERVDTVLEPVMRGVLTVAGVIDGDERVIGVYRFSELTLVITDRRVVKHVGSALWDEDYETFPYADLTGLAFTEGSVATEVVVETDGRPDRFKAPNDGARFVRRDLENAVFAFHDVDSLAALNAKVGPEEEEPDRTDPFATDDLEPLTRQVERDEPEAEEPDRTDDSAADDGGFTFDRIDTADENGTGGTDEAAPAGDGDVAERLAALEETVQRQSEVIERQATLLEQLVEELRAGR